MRGLTITASISASSHVSAGVFQNRSGSKWMSSATSRPSMVTFPSKPLPLLPLDPFAPSLCDEEELSFSGWKWGPELKTSLKWSKEEATCGGAAGWGCGVCESLGARLSGKRKPGL